MLKLMERLENSLFFPIKPGMAARIARRHCLGRQRLLPLSNYRVLPGKPARSAIYNEPRKPAWYVCCPWGDEPTGA